MLSLQMHLLSMLVLRQKGGRAAVLAGGSTLGSSCAPSEAPKGQDISAVQTFLLLGAWAMAHPWTTALLASFLPSILGESPWPGQALQSPSEFSA